MMMEMSRIWTLFAGTFAVIVSVCSGSCYFPAEFQGIFLMQMQSMYTGSQMQMPPGAITFSEIRFEADAIPPWGKCHQRRGNNVILKDSTGGEDCMRCFHLTLKTPNVIQIHTEGLGKCYTKEEAVKATCPDDRAVRERKFKEIMLYRKQEKGENNEDDSVPDPVFCPISGKFRFTYTAGGGEFRCTQTLSEVANCPSGNTLSVRFKQCSFPDLEVQFQCLGDWEGTNSDRYLALMDLHAGDSQQQRPKFRCGSYRVDPLTGRVFVSLSADSTCHNQLRSPTDGYESLILTPFPEKSPPAPVLQSRCRFPEWVQGRWEQHVHVLGNVLVYRDQAKLQKMTLNCLRRDNDTPEDRFVVFAAAHCGEESYNCLWLKRRSPNVMEFQMGSHPSDSYSDSLCHDEQFSPNGWITQGREKPLQMFPCPITGDYTGVLPESSGHLCAKVASDCNNPDVMFYTVSNCQNRSQVYEEREYRCFGSWQEKNGVTFTYAQRREMDGFQCFSGKVLQNGKEAFIKEAGRSCIRGEDPFVYGMKITKHASCPDLGLPPHDILNPSFADSDDDLFKPSRPSSPDDPYWYQKEAKPSPNQNLHDNDYKRRWNPATLPPEDSNEESATSPSRALSTCSSSAILVILSTTLGFYSAKNNFFKASS